MPKVQIHVLVDKSIVDAMGDGNKSLIVRKALTQYLNPSNRSDVDPSITEAMDNLTKAHDELARLLGSNQ